MEFTNETIRIAVRVYVKKEKTFKKEETNENTEEIKKNDVTLLTNLFTILLLYMHYYIYNVQPRIFRQKCS